MNKNLASLERALGRCLTSTESTECVVVIRKITRTWRPMAIAVLASRLDSPGPIGAAAVRGLQSFGPLAETEMRRCVAQSMDKDPIRNAHRVLAALGDAYSRRAVRACCWADRDDEDAIAARAADAANDSAPPASAIVRAASQPDRPWAAIDRPDPAIDRPSTEGYRPSTAVDRPETRGDRRAAAVVIDPQLRSIDHQLRLIGHQPSLIGHQLSLDEAASRRLCGLKGPGLTCSA